MTSALRPLGVAHFSWIDARPADFVRAAAKVGFASVGLRLHPAFPGAPFYAVAPGSAEMRETKTALRQDGIAVHDIEFVVIDGAFALQDLSSVLDSAAELGARRLSVCGDDADGGRFIDNVSALADRANAVGIGIDLEIMPWRRIGTLAAARDAVAAAGREDIGILVDALHLARSGGTPLDLIGLAPSLLRSVQICDAPAERPADTAALIAEARGGRLHPGSGDLPLDDLLAAVPPEAMLSVEVPKGADADGGGHLRALFEATTALLRRAGAGA